MDQHVRPAINSIGGFPLRTRMWWPAELIAPSTIVMMEAGFLLH